MNIERNEFIYKKINILIRKYIFFEINFALDLIPTIGFVKTKYVIDLSWQNITRN